jgi:predicted nucleotidyltransferase
MLKLGESDCGLPMRTLTALDTFLGKYPGIESAILYGSRAMGRFRPESDIDITLKTTKLFTHDDLLHLSADFDESTIPYKIDLSVYNNLSNENLKDHIRRVGKELYRNSSPPT